MDAELREIPVEAIVPNRRQPRSIFDEAALAELAESIRAHGILQPIALRELGGGKFELIAGERRWRASKLAGLKSVPSIVRAADPLESLELALIENIQREDIGPLECARAYRKLIDEFRLTQEAVAAQVGKSRTAIANTLRLLRLPPAIQDGLEAGEIQEGHARALLALDSTDRQLALFEQIVLEGLSVREVERLARKPGKTPLPRRVRLPESWPALEDALSTALGSRVKVSQADEGGKIVVEFYSEEDLSRILDLLGVSL